ncbi:hypothetical protein FDC58_16795 [Clostridium botulinum]|uniref:hypothetical protein n=1 Tax=Clostridium cagae TaxID=2080751 RepID=UPI0014295990|nr:hypothetical protein [Clostridium botulinum]NFO89041.1 hypothetical protein [Clostridium botulinum]NFP30851.1 hypothetical protein [Clostridium botulinum]
MKTTELIERLKNPGTIITLVSLVILVLTTNGVLVDNERVMTTVQAICSIGVILGVLNNPGTDGVDLPFITSSKENKKED